MSFKIIKYIDKQVFFKKNLNNLFNGLLVYRISWTAQKCHIGKSIFRPQIVQNNCRPSPIEYERFTESIRC